MDVSSATPQDIADVCQMYAGNDPEMMEASLLSLGATAPQLCAGRHVKACTGDMRSEEDLGGATWIQFESRGQVHIVDQGLGAISSHDVEDPVLDFKGILRVPEDYELREDVYICAFCGTPVPDMDYVEHVRDEHPFIHPDFMPFINGEGDVVHPAPEYFSV